MFVSSCSGSVFGLRHATGEIVWTYDTRQDGGQTEFHGTPVVTPELIVAATDDRRPGGVAHLYAFERVGGKVSWKLPVGAGAMTDLALVGGDLYLATLGETVMSVRAATGEANWVHETGRSNERFFPTSTPVVLGDQVLFGGVDGSLVALARGDGKVLWTRQLGDRVATSVVLAGDRLYLGTADGKLHLLNAADGAVVRSATLPGVPFGRPLVHDDSVIVLTTGGRAVALAVSLERTVWEARLDAEWAAFRPLVVGGLVLGGADDGRVHALRAGDGSAAWSHDFGGPVTSLTADGATLYVGTSRGIVYSAVILAPG